MSVTVAECTDVVRLLLADIDDANPAYAPEGVNRSVIGMTRAYPRIGLTFSPDRRNLRQPDGTDPTATQFALLSFRVAKQFASANPDGYEFRTRALTEKMGGWSNLLWELENSMHELENGDLMSEWQQLHAFLQGNRGLKLGYVVTQMKGPYPSFQLNYPVMGGAASAIDNPQGN